MIFCTKCGQQNDDTARTCANCGAPFGGQSGTTPFTTADPTSAGAQQTGSPWATPSYAEQAYMQPGMSGIMTPGEKRDPIMVLILGLVTCGIYMIYWIYTTSTEIKNALGREDINPVLDVVLSLVTCGIWLIYLSYRYPQLILELQDRARIPRNDISVISLILTIVGLSPVAFFMIQSELNKVWEAAGRR
jgi:Domain of unknown function (DUF4234)/zinc-ribbon domain